MTSVRQACYADHVFVFGRTFDQRDLDVVAPSGVGDVARIGADKVQVDAWILAMKDAEIFRDHVGRDRGACADAEAIAVEVAQRASSSLGRRSRRREQGFGMPRQCLSLGSAARPSRRAIKQPAADLQFPKSYPFGWQAG